MLAEMDDRLALLQRELETLSVAVPWQTPEESRAPARRPAPPPPVRAEPSDLAAEPEAAGSTAIAHRARRRRPPVVGRGQAVLPGDDTPSRPSAPASAAVAADAIVNRTIVEAEQEARRVVDDARRQVAAIGARARAALEQSVAAPAPLPVARRPGTPAPRPAARARGRRAQPPAARAEGRTYEGTVTLEAGPFADVAQLKEYEAALSSVDGIDDVYIGTFERSYAHFLLRVARPTPIVAELQTRLPDTLDVIETASGDLRLEIVRGEPAGMSSR